MSSLNEKVERWQKAILHIDMDAFFANVEVLRDPSLRGKPVIVGGDSSRGVVAACTYEARSYGVRSAMSTVEAKRRCPHAVFVGGKFSAYEETSREILRIMGQYTPYIEPISLDEAFLDITGSQSLFGTPALVASKVRKQIKHETHLDCSVGVAQTKMLAKLASEAAKPIVGAPGSGPRQGRGVYVVLPGFEQEFLDPLHVRAMWGVGPKTGERLNAIGIQTIKDLRTTSFAALERAFNSRLASHLLEMACGNDPREVDNDRDRKSIGQEETFAFDRFAKTEVGGDLLKLCEGVARRMGEIGVGGTTLTLKVKFADFEIQTLSRTLQQPTSSALRLYEIADHLLAEIDWSRGLRLLGVHVSNIANVHAHQLSLLGDPSIHNHQAKTSRLDEAAVVIADIRKKFGARSVGLAGLISDCGTNVGEREERWGHNIGHSEGKNSNN